LRQFICVLNNIRYRIAAAFASCHWNGAERAGIITPSCTFKKLRVLSFIENEA
jgi:hypothetical protein